MMVLLKGEEGKNEGLAFLIWGDTRPNFLLASIGKIEHKSQRLLPDLNGVQPRAWETDELEWHDHLQRNCCPIQAAQE